MSKIYLAIKKFKFWIVRIIKIKWFRIEQMNIKTKDLKILKIGI
jgi:hypothetical protein